MLALSAVLALGACTGAPTPGPTSSTPTVQPLQWRTADLGGMTPSTVLVSGGRLWVSGFTGSGANRAPAISMDLVGGPDEHMTLMEPPLGESPYGKLADLFSLAGDGQQLIGIGVAHGGAHANPRWSTWNMSSSPAPEPGGTTAPQGPAQPGTTQLLEQPQLFWTFGGEEAGGLIGAAWDAKGPMIVGTWQGKAGLDGAIWRRAGATWSQVTPPKELVNSATRQVSPVRVDEVGVRRVVVSGSVLDLTDGVRQSAAIWRDADDDWSLTTLPDPGKRSQAWSTACETECSTVGFRDGRVALWVGSRMPQPLPVSSSVTDTGVVVRSSGTTIAAVSSNGTGRLVVGTPGAWRVLQAPTGTPRAMAVVGGWLYLVTGNGDATKLYTVATSGLLPASG